ncbi:hypothetical protein NFI96_003374, partial [Prochilodus magdalenae]
MPWLPLLSWTLLSFLGGVDAAPEAGHRTFTVNNTSRPLMVRKSMYKDTNIRLKVASFNCPEEVSLTFRWFLKYYPCHNEYINVDEMYDRTPLSRGEGMDPNPLGQGEYIEHKYSTLTCDRGMQFFPAFNKSIGEPRPVDPTKEVDPNDANYTRWLTGEVAVREKDDVIVTTWRDGPYLLVVLIETGKKEVSWNLTINVVMKGAHGFISVTEWPLMIFYMVMCIVYILYALLWFIWASCYWKDLLRIQFWIAGVIFLGMVEMAVFCAEFENTNAVGSACSRLAGFCRAHLCPQEDSCSNLLVIIVSLGYGTCQ